ncbi:phosphotransferase [Sporosarcina sp. Marseille-Q4063]|uniref:choline kinase family protein n=1 Tax=Sporosarcina sp. Marseille-Q4063 TaxID=2810514 RepID=UPI001BB083F7|nr:choline kinase family protein [Sporosarcina sp. Marseille-Q4063]QUW21048.1 phosphotransferase [Sporosarcina sp. Marseille-Q4063]
MEKLIDLIREALQLPDAKIENIETTGGMTNLNYLVTIDSADFIVRIPGNGTEEFIDRRIEKENLEFASSLGINPELRYFNLETGLKVTKKIVNATTLTPTIASEEKTMVKIAEIFRTVHNSNRSMSNRFELFEMMANFEELALEAGAEFFDGFDEVKKDINTLQQYFDDLKIKEVPCHIDPACSNFIISDEDKVYLIDWEYSGMFDPMWDIAAHALEAKLTETEEAFFVRQYFGREATVAEEKRMLLHKIFQDYLWSLWTLFKEEKGDDFGAYGKNRFERARKNIEIFNQAE